MGYVMRERNRFQLDHLEGRFVERRDSRLQIILRLITAFTLPYSLLSVSRDQLVLSGPEGLEPPDKLRHESALQSCLILSTDLAGYGARNQERETRGGKRLF